MFLEASVSCQAHWEQSWLIPQKQGLPGYFSVCSSREKARARHLPVAASGGTWHKVEWRGIRIQVQKPQPATEHHLCSSDQMKLLNPKYPPYLRALDCELTWCLTAFPPA